MKAYERFLNYVSFDTQSDENSGTVPSTAKQKALGAYLLEELKSLGAVNAEMDENGYVYATVPAGKGYEHAPVLALIAHMDTAMDMSGKDVKARIVKAYQGGDIVLNEEKQIVTTVERFPELLSYVGEDIIVTDGTTLLGCDDKAGLAEIMTVAEKMLSGELQKHPEIRIVFTPDEEIGRGVEHIDMQKVNAACGYTVDGGAAGELSYENFNAASAEIRFQGVCVHTGDAFGVMQNASLLAMEFHSMLPVFANPAATLDRMGFFHLHNMEGKEETAKLSYLLRDHDAAKLEEKKTLILEAAAFMNKKYGEGTVIAEVKDSYRNMYEKILPDYAFLIDRARAAAEESGVAGAEPAVRGGTDGATLSFMGLPCPNLGTGGHAFHGCHEFVSVQAMDRVVSILEHLVEKFV